MLLYARNDQTIGKDHVSVEQRLFLGKVLIVQLHAVRAQLMGHTDDGIDVAVNRGIIVQNPPQEFAILFHTLFPEDIVRKAEIGFRLALLLCGKHRAHLVGDKKRIVFIVAYSKQGDSLHLTPQRCILGRTVLPIPVGLPDRQPNRRMLSAAQWRCARTAAEEKRKEKEEYRHSIAHRFSSHPIA